MEELRKSIRSIKNKMELSVKLPHQIATIAFKLFLLLNQSSGKDKEIKLLVSEFIEALHQSEFDNILDIQTDYAIKIASHDSQLEYEEMHKLFCLCDEIYAMEYLGLTFSETKRKQFDNSLRNLFEQESENAKIAAKMNIESWNSQLWWYKENMG